MDFVSHKRNQSYYSNWKSMIFLTNNKTTACRQNMGWSMNNMSVMNNINFTAIFITISCRLGPRCICILTSVYHGPGGDWPEGGRCGRRMRWGERETGELGWSSSCDWTDCNWWWTGDVYKNMVILTFRIKEKQLIKYSIVFR